MNDLTFGATLLACFASLVVTVVLEASSAAPRKEASPAAAVAANHGQAPRSQAGVKDCAGAVQLSSASQVSSASH